MVIAIEILELGRSKFCRWTMKIYRPQIADKTLPPVWASTTSAKVMTPYIWQPTIRLKPALVEGIGTTASQANSSNMLIIIPSHLLHYEYVVGWEYNGPRSTVALSMPHGVVG